MNIILKNNWRAALLGCLLPLILSSCASGEGSSASQGPLPPIPELARWEASMREYAVKYCDAAKLKELGTWEGSVWYYDGARVYFQIADYTGNRDFERCARLVREIYRAYVFESGGKVTGWRVFPHGLAEDFWRSADEQSKRAALLLATDSVFAPKGGGADAELSRETAYLINAYLIAERLGAKRHPMLDTAVNYALSHLSQWFEKRSTSYIKPFMAGLTFEALIGYYHESGDSRVPAAILSALDRLYEAAWDPNAQAMRYIVCKRPDATEECRDPQNLKGAPDLNLLIAPAYAWAYRQTGENRYLERGDLLFASGVRNSWLGQGKQFSQNYRWSFDFVRWRQGK